MFYRLNHSCNLLNYVGNALLDAFSFMLINRESLCLGNSSDGLIILLRSFWGKDLFKKRNEIRQNPSFASTVHLNLFWLTVVPAFCNVVFWGRGVTFKGRSNRSCKSVQMHNSVLKILRRKWEMCAIFFVFVILSVSVRDKIFCYCLTIIDHTLRTIVCLLWRRARLSCVMVWGHWRIVLIFVFASDFQYCSLLDCISFELIRVHLYVAFSKIHTQSFAS